MPLSRREFLALSTVSSAAAISGCATNPVTGKSMFMLISEGEEISMDQNYSPHQFSADYGAVQDVKLNKYISDVGLNIAKLSHRPQMPYNMRVLNAVDVNGYTFPAGSMGIARGLMLQMQNEAQLAAVLGHEIGHVNARHAGSRMSKNILVMGLVGVVVAVVESEYENRTYSTITAGLGSLGAHALLAKYSRANEREADSLGVEYMSRAGYNPKGMVGLMNILMSLRDSEPGLVELLFSSHPMSSERRQDAIDRIKAEYPNASAGKESRERYMDHTASIRKLKQPIEMLQKAQMSLYSKKFSEAEGLFITAVNKAPNDYTALLMTSKCYLMQKKFAKSAEYCRRARNAYPKEAQAMHIQGMAKMGDRKYQAALTSFLAYENTLPGNENSIYFQGFCQEKMGRRPQAAVEYKRYLVNAQQGEYAGLVTQKLIDWGYMKRPEPQS